MGYRVEFHNETTNYQVPKTRRILIGNELKFFSRASDIIVLGQSFTRYFYIKRVRYEEMFHDSTSN